MKSLYANQNICCLLLSVWASSKSFEITNKTVSPELLKQILRWWLFYGFSLEVLVLQWLQNLL